MVTLLTAMFSADPFYYHFFVSYTTREDEVKALLPRLEEFVQQLRNYGYDGRLPVWWDRVNLGKFRGSDEQLRDALVHGLNECISVIAFVSPGYIASEYCKFEWNFWVTQLPHEPKSKLPLNATFLMPIVWKDIDALHHDIRSLHLLDDVNRFRLEINDFRSWKETTDITLRVLQLSHERRMERWNALHGNTVPCD
jgi:TIR domain